jgi:tetratricopeptide (TPR) repeat protein
MIGRRARLALAGSGLAAVLVLLVSWLARDRLHGAPGGPSLPPQPPDRRFSPEVIELSNRATLEVLRDEEEALRLLDEALALDPQYHLGWANKGQLLLRRGEYAKAASCLEKATELRPRTAEYRVGHAACLWRAGLRDESRLALLRALSAYEYRMAENPGSLWARTDRALVLHLLGRTELARAELRKMEERAGGETVRTKARGLREAIDRAEGGDPWAVLGLDN